MAALAAAGGRARGSGCVYHAFGGRAAGGNNLIIDEIHEPTAWIPRRMAPLVYVATVTTHLFGGSAGREGTAIQMSGSLSDAIVNRLAGFSGTDRRLVLIAAISGGFGAVFGVPMAGCVFGLEVQSVGRIRHDAIVPALTAAVVGNEVVEALGVDHTPLPLLDGARSRGRCWCSRSCWPASRSALTAIVFSELTHGLKHVFARDRRVAAAAPVHRRSRGGRPHLRRGHARLPRAVDPADHRIVRPVRSPSRCSRSRGSSCSPLSPSAPGFQGGEVTPLFVIGATLGATLGHALARRRSRCSPRWGSSRCSPAPRTRRSRAP